MKRLVFISIAVSATAQTKLSKDNIDEVIKAMSLEEKVNILVGGSRAVNVNGFTSGTIEVLVPGAAGVTRAVPRFGIPQTALPACSSVLPVKVTATPIMQLLSL